MVGVVNSDYRWTRGLENGVFDRFLLRDVGTGPAELAASRRII